MHACVVISQMTILGNPGALRITIVHARCRTCIVAVSIYPFPAYRNTMLHKAYSFIYSDDQFKKQIKTNKKSNDLYKLINIKMKNNGLINTK